MGENEADYAETLCVAYQRYLTGDLDSIEALLDPDVYGRAGIAAMSGGRRHLPDEVGVRPCGPRRRRRNANRPGSSCGCRREGDRVLVALEPTGSNPRELYQVYRFDKGLIVRIDGFSSRAKAHGPLDPLTASDSAGRVQS